MNDLEKIKAEVGNMEKQEIINSLNAIGKWTVSEDGRHIAFKTSGRRGDSIHVGHYRPSTTAGAVAEADIIKLAVSEQSGGALILALAEIIAAEGQEKYEKARAEIVAASMAKIEAEGKIIVEMITSEPDGWGEGGSIYTFRTPDGTLFRSDGYCSLYNGNIWAFTPEYIAEAAITAAEHEAREKEKIESAEKARARDAEKKANRIAEIKAWLAAHPRETLPTGKAAREEMRVYNNIHNEGGEGFVPYIDSQDDYDCLQSELAELSKP